MIHVRYVSFYFKSVMKLFVKHRIISNIICSGVGWGDISICKLLPTLNSMATHPMHTNYTVGCICFHAECTQPLPLCYRYSVLLRAMDTTEAKV